MPDIPDTIVCPDCGGIAHCISYLADRGERGQGFPDDADAFTEQGEIVVAYRCSDCLDRWDVIWDDTGGTETETGDEGRR